MRKQIKKKFKKGKSGITLIALVVTIIVLLILAGISIGMLTGNNGILKQARNAKTETNNSSAIEQIKIEALGSFDKNGYLDLGKLTTNLGSIGATLTGEKFPVAATLDGASYIIDENGNVEKYSGEDRTGIEVGDYITYVPPARSAYSLTAGASGYSSDQTLTQQYTIWRVLNKNVDGTIDIMPAFINQLELPSGISNYTSIYFSDAKGWNNAPYLLDDMCKTLYEAPNSDSKKTITARSIDYEDIISHMIPGVEGTSSSNSTGLKKISKYQSEKVGLLTTGTSIDSISGTTVTYINRTSHPTLYFNVKDNLSNPYYTSSTIDISSSTNGRISSENKPETLSLEYTDYYGTIASTDFENNNTYSVLSTGSAYWLASRSIYCEGYDAEFSLRASGGGQISPRNVFGSDGSPHSHDSRISPIVTLGSEVKITKCEGNNYPSNRHTVVIP